MISDVNVFLLAAGLGTRFQPLTLKYPKPSIPFLNVPMGLYQFQYLPKLNICNLVVNTFHLPDKITEVYKNQPYFKGNLHFSHEKGSILGSAGGLKKASAFMDLKKPILLMNADEIYFTQNKDFLNQALAQHIQNKNLATLIVMEHPETGIKFGSVWGDKNKVVNISKKPTEEPRKNWHFIGAMFISPEILSNIPDGKESNIFYDVLNNRIPEGQVEIFPLNCHWFETGNPKDFIKASKIVLKERGEELLDFINQYDPSTLIRNERSVSLVSNSAQVEKEKLSGFNVIGRDVAITGSIGNSILFDQELISEN